MNSMNIPEHFQPLAFLIGDWKGEFADGSTTDFQHFEWDQGGLFIHNRHQSRGARGEHAGQSVYAWDPLDQRVIFFYWDNTGGTSRGHFEVVGEELHAEEEYRGAHSYKMRSVWRPLGGDAYEAEQYGMKEGEWRSLWATRYERTS